MDEKQVEQLVNKRMAETAEKIKTAVDDLAKNMASTKEVTDLIDERTKQDKDLLAATKADVDTLNSGAAEVAAQVAELKKQVRRVNSFQREELFSGGAYTGKFSSPLEAKRFALLVMASVTAGIPELQAQHEMAVKGVEDNGLEPCWVDKDGRKAMTGSSLAGGGVLVTVEQSPTILKLLETYGVFRARARRWPMGAGQSLVPKIDGLLTVTCPGEGVAATESDPTLKLTSLTPKTLLALTCFGLELEEDSLVALGELLADLFTRSFAYYEDLCGFLGDGTSTYFGFKGITGALRAVDATIANIKSLFVGAGNAYSELTLANFDSVVGTLPQFADVGDPRWYVHRYFYWTVMVRLALAVGGVNATEVVLGAGQKQKQFLGYPAEFTQVMPRVEANSQICAIFGDLAAGAFLGTRGGLEFATSDQRYFDKGLIGVRGRDRIAINVHGVGDTTNAGPISAQITAAS